MDKRCVHEYLIVRAYTTCNVKYAVAMKCKGERHKIRAVVLISCRHPTIVSNVYCAWCLMACDGMLFSRLAMQECKKNPNAAPKNETKNIAVIGESD